MDGRDPKVEHDELDEKDDVADREDGADALLKKKRRQNVACDSCKLRRIRCDLLNLLLARQPPGLAAGPHAEDSLDIALHPDVACSACTAKDIRCTRERAMNPVRPKRGGKRIDEAKRLWGDGRDGPPTAVAGGGAGASVAAGAGASSLAGPSVYATPPTLLELPVSAAATTADGLTPTEPRSARQPSSPAPNPFLAWAWAPKSPSPDTAANAVSADDAWSSYMFSQIPLADVAAQAYTPDPSAAFTIVYGSGQTQTGALPLTWDLGSALRVGDTTAGTGAGAGAGASAGAAYPPARPGAGSPDLPPWSARASGSSDGSSSSTAGAGAASTPGKRPRSGSGPDTRDPMHLWRTGDSRWLWGAAGGGPAWGRADAVSSLLIDRALGSQLSRHLIDVFFRTTIWAWPIINAQHFMEAYNSVDRTDKLNAPGMEALCAVMEAWAARYSDLPLMFGGLDPSDPANKHYPIGHWGSARLPVCNALLERSRKLVDDQGLVRRSNLESLQALQLYGNLINAADSRVKTMGTLLESRSRHAILCDSLETMLQQEAERGVPTCLAPADTLERQVSEFRSGENRLAWVMLIFDGMWAAGSRSSPRLPADLARHKKDITTRMLGFIPTNWCRFIHLAYAGWYEIISVGRDLAEHVSVPSRTPADVDLPAFCASAEAIFHRLNDSVRSLDRQFLPVLDPSEPTPAGFDPLQSIISLRMCHTILHLLAYQIVMEQLAYRRSREPDSRTTADMAMLGRLTRQSADELLANCRSHARMAQALMAHPTGYTVLRNASLPMRSLIRVTQILAQLPCNEQGYPSSMPGGFEFTWAAKEQEVEWCLEAIEVMGWSWADSPSLTANIRRSLARMRPTDAQRAAHAARPGQHVHESRAEGFRRAVAEERALVARALEFEYRSACQSSSGYTPATGARRSD